MSLLGVVTLRAVWSARFRMWPKVFIGEPTARPRLRVVAISISGRVKM